jgi:catechol 2,3-dioxygenase-like lactoylglutathione lyase family enzyme
MIGFVMIGTDNLEKSSKFYDVVLNELDMAKVFVGERYVGYSEKNNPKKIELYVTIPFDNKKPTNGNGTMIALLAKSKKQVDKFHQVALQNGAFNEGFPGKRKADPNGYYAYIRDLNGNKICVHSKVS